MKKSTLFLACCIGLMFFASCKKEVKPTISIATGANYVSQSTQVFAGDPITVGFSATGENLTKIEMNALQNGTVLYTNAQNIDDAAASYLYAHTFTLDAIGTVTINGIVTDAKGNTATTSFDIICYEKPNAKFVGQYEGNTLITGSYDINVNGMDPMHEDLTDQPFPIVVTMVAGDNNDEVMATITIHDQENTVKGTVDGNKVILEAINDTYTMHYEYQGFDLPISMNMTYNIVGTLNDGMLDLDGSCKGNGDFNMFIISGTIEMEGTVGGSLTKTE
jgi:hypothetical protein